MWAARGPGAVPTPDTGTRVEAVTLSWGLGSDPDWTPVIPVTVAKVKWGVGDGGMCEPATCGRAGPTKSRHCLSAEGSAGDQRAGMVLPCWHVTGNRHCSHHP